MSKILAAVLAAFAGLAPGLKACADDAKPLTGPPSLDLSGYHLTFDDEFDRMDIAYDTAPGTWWAPVHGSFGGSTFGNPSGDGPYRVKGGMLTIRMEYNAPQHKWRSGNIQTLDSKGRGFAQQYGYFEMRAKLPNGAATWPGFWLLSRNGLVDPTVSRGEIDVIEAYGPDVDTLHSTVHVWPPTDMSRHPLHDRHWYNSQRVRAHGLADGFHRYGVKITPAWTIFYVDGIESARQPTLDEFKTPMYMLVTLAVFPKTMEGAPSPQDLLVDYVRAYAGPDTPKAPGAPPGPAPEPAVEGAKKG